MISDSSKYFCKEMKHCLNNKKYRINLTDVLIWAMTWQKKKKYNNNNKKKEKNLPHPYTMISLTLAIKQFIMYLTGKD